MNKALSITGGLIGAFFVGAASFALSYKHTEISQYGSISVPYTVVGYPELVSVFIAIAIGGFVLLAIGLASKSSDSLRDLSRFPTPIEMKHCPQCSTLNDYPSMYCKGCGLKLR